jgi:hypothetical protein
LLARRSYNPRTISLAGVAHSLRVSQRFTDNSFEFSFRAAQTRVNHVAQRVANQIPPPRAKNKVNQEQNGFVLNPFRSFAGSWARAFCSGKALARDKSRS